MLPAVVSLLEKRIGLAAGAVGTELIARVVRRHMGESGISSEDEYVGGLEKSGELWESLVEALVIPETWFFRNRQSFSFLSAFARSEWLDKPREGVVRVLSCPCATGEEPYSIAMTLLDAGMPPGSFLVDGFDISNPLLEKARAGVYGPESFRGSDLAFRDRHFDAEPGGFRLRPSVMEPVRFCKTNILDVGVSLEHGVYDAVFCRNLLIYLTPSAKRRVVRVLERMLDKEGVVFVGHIEHEVFSEFGFERIRRPGVFACRKPRYPRCARKGRMRPGDLENGTENEKAAAPAVSGPAAAGAAGPVSAGSSPAGRERSVKSHAPGSPALKSPPGSAGPAPDAPGIRTSSGSGGIGPASASAPRQAGKPDGMDRMASDLLQREGAGGNMTGGPDRGGRVPDPNSGKGLSPASSFDTARELADRGLLQDALDLCVELLGKDALHIPARFLMGVICMALKDTRSAADCFNRVVYLDPGHGEALEYLAQIADEDGDPAGAAQFRRRAQRVRARGDVDR